MVAAVCLRHCSVSRYRLDMPLVPTIAEPPTSLPAEVLPEMSALPWVLVRTDPFEPVGPSSVPGSWSGTLSGGMFGSASSATEEVVPWSSRPSWGALGLSGGGLLMAGSPSVAQPAWAELGFGSSVQPAVDCAAATTVLASNAAAQGRDDFA